MADYVFKFKCNPHYACMSEILLKHTVLIDPGFGMLIFLQCQSWIAELEILWLTKSRIFTGWFQIFLLPNHWAYILVVIENHILK